MKIRRSVISLITILSLILTVGCSGVVGDIEVKDKDESMVVSAKEAKNEANDFTTSEKEEPTTEKKKDTATQKQTEKKTEATTESITKKVAQNNSSQNSNSTVSSPPSDNSNSCNQQTGEESSTEQNTSEPETTECATETSEQPPEENSEAPQQTTVSYSPQSVVSLATSKCISGGMIKITDYLDELLASGSITQEEYDDYYPYDGLGYYSVFVETDLNAASTTSGRKLGSEQSIADYIADMLLLEREPYFLIEYGGESGGFYEFRCYR